MRDDFDQGRDAEAPTLFTSLPAGDGSRPAIGVDYEAYAHFLEGTDLSEAEKQELLQSLWNVVVEFVALGFGVHPLQQVGAPGENDAPERHAAETAKPHKALEAIDA